MSLFETFRDAVEAAFTNKFRSALTMLGVVVGVLAVVLLVSIGQGARSYVVDQFAGLGSNVLIITPGKTETTGGPPIISQTVRKLSVEDALDVEKRSSLIDKVAPVVFGSSGIKYRNRKRDVNIVGTTYEFQDIRNLHVDVGSFIPERTLYAERRICVLGRKAKTELFGSENPLGKFIKIGLSKYRVIGIMEKKGISLGFDLDDLVFIPVKSAQEHFNTNGLLEILASVVNAGEVDRATEQVREVLMKRHNEVEDFTITSQGAIISTLDSILGALTYVLTAIGAISLIVGGVGIMNIMLASVGERTREIGIRKAVGAKNRDVLLHFLVESVTLSGGGGVIGIALGLGIIYLVITLVPSLPVDVSLWTILLAFSFSVAVGMFFGVYPARRAALLDPIESLRYE